MKTKLLSLVVVMLLLATSPIWSAGTQETGTEMQKVTVNIISHRFPALEFMAKAITEEAPPNVKVIADLMPYDKYFEKAKITLSAGSSAYDIIWGNTGGLADFATKGWMVPLNDYLEK